MASSDPSTQQPDLPATLRELIDDADTTLGALLHQADALPDHAISSDFAGETVAEILAHLHGWHELFLGWVEADAKGKVPDFPAAGYDWDTLGELNSALIAARADYSYAELRDLLTESHAAVCAALKERDDAALFDVNSYAWLGHASLGYVAYECLGNHYRWGIAMLGECAAP
ncbi:ClbS/DfsB family four-helix bundle protein [Demequina sediminicola]|uniref:ClbS/DfsB family four-helix bundle protein n=1 Tax=Demequina sediminicola TaxID=1095026 RepID=UPI0007828B92|nr:ClbS/DfsB family four-helix bundle protein [Demequina sediminicola]